MHPCHFGGAQEAWGSCCGWHAVSRREAAISDFMGNMAVLAPSPRILNMRFKSLYSEQRHTMIIVAQSLAHSLGVRLAHVHPNAHILGVLLYRLRRIGHGPRR